ncbi:YicC family protein [Virgibacillus sp. NKC19-16]|uniref:YicC/YloC family endoribonuclease n=1 Tax=Virgibacillus salidurans TaxID=2831673 RepID=UPI001F38A7A4|nr:YicC/YloC family endoribonuclease [Virgibacillus sp. NKC19-16]UJL47885.1 YicC family protein [Virgibacillus sp. NKC19-16]
MAMSMTGYGTSTSHLENTMLTVEIRSVNHRYLDFTAKIPRFFLFLEDKIKKIIQSYFGRGRIEVYISIEGESFVKKTVKTDWDLMDQYMDQLGKAKSRYHLIGDIPAEILAAIPELITIREAEEYPDGLKDAILTCTKEACEQVRVMRQEEGVFLSNDLEERLNTIYNIVSLLQTNRIRVMEEYRERIQKRIRDHLDDNTVDQARVYQEIVLLAEKGDITEEVVRLLAHIEHFRGTLNTAEPIGRTLDFITQEMHREANTIGSKSTDTEISAYTVSLKREIEKMKEQLQNIE